MILNTYACPQKREWISSGNIGDNGNFAWMWRRVFMEFINFRYSSAYRFFKRILIYMENYFILLGTDYAVLPFYRNK